MTLIGIGARARDKRTGRSTNLVVSRAINDLLSGAVRNAAEQGNFFHMLVRDYDVIDPCLAIKNGFLCYSCKHVTMASRSAVGDGAVESKSAVVARIASEGKGRIGKAEGHSAMADAEAVDHVFSDD